MKRIRILFIFLLATILWFSEVTQSQTASTCSQIKAGSGNTLEYACNDVTGCKYQGDQCVCQSDVKLDILFGVDTSGSIGFAGFQVQKNFIEGLVNQGVGNSSRIGFTMFGTQVNNSRGVQLWPSRSALSNYAKGIYWTAGWTNTPELIADAITEFRNTKDAERQQVLMMITDGNPCLPESQGGCPQSVCGMSAAIKLAGIRVVIIGVGDGLETKYVQCLCQSADDFIPVTSYSDDNFDDILPSLSGILCPISKEFKVTEVKGFKKTNILNFRMNRFVEIYNTGIGFNLNEITISGLVVGTALPSAAVAQGQYVVFYDAANTLGQPGSYTGSADAMVTCHLCPIGTGQCDLGTGTNQNYCGNGRSGVGNTGYPGFCWCFNSLYVACDNEATSTCDSDNMPSTGPGTIDACTNSECTFTDSMTKTSWDITFTDTAGAVEIDTVTYDPNTWITADDGYSYELITKGFDNDIGDNWAQSCSKYGTPGSDPKATCTEECQAGGCGFNTTCQGNGVCDCSTVTGLYPKCNDLTGSTPSGCAKCAIVPGIDDCEVRIIKNGTRRYAVFNWTEADREGLTKYEIDYKEGTDFTFSNIYASDQYDTDNLTWGGWVRTVVVVCHGPDCEEGIEPNRSDPNVNCVCTDYPSDKTLCNVITVEPTTSPTPAPTDNPTSSPSAAPTPPPTLGCPYYFWDNSDVCDPERCLCEEKPRECCLLDYEFNVIDQGEDRKHKESFECKMDEELDKPQLRDQGENAAGSSEGYLLSTSSTAVTHTFPIKILDDPEDSDSTNYPCQMNIFWRFVFENLNCNYDGGTATDCDSTSNSLARAGLAIDKTSGWLKVWGADDTSNATVIFQVSRLSCDDINSTSTNPGGQGQGNHNCFDHISIKGVLEIVNATPAASCRDGTCPDHRIYPMRIPVYYNYQDAFTAPPSSEKELPPWLWWLIAALVVFLALMAFLVYKYWWANKATGAALDSVQNDLDAAVTEQEDGFGAGLAGNAIGFNPLATGFNPNAAAGAVGPNAPLGRGGNRGDFVRPNNKREVFTGVYGPKAGALR